MAISKKDFEAFLKTLPSSVSDDVRKIVEMLSTGLTPGALQRIADLKASRRISPYDYNKILGYVYSGESALEGAWTDIAKGFAIGTREDEAAGIYKYRKVLNTVLTPGNAQAVAKSLGFSTTSKEYQLFQDLYSSDIVRKGLTGTQNPQQAMGFAVTAASKMIEDPTLQKIVAKAGAYLPELMGVAGKGVHLDDVKKYIGRLSTGDYLEAYRTFDTLIMSNLDVSGASGQAFVKAVGFTKELGTVAQQLYEAASTMDPDSNDASGVVLAGISAAQRITLAAGALALHFNPGDKAKIDGITKGISVGLGCISSIGAGVAAGSVAGGLLGAVSCGISVASMIMGSKKSPDPVKHLPAAHFSPSAEQMPVIAADADRLALVLRFHYGVKDYKHISERVSRFAWEGDFLNPALGGYPTAAGDKRPVPGFTMLDVINALRFEAKPTAAMPYGSTAFNQYYGINAGAWGRGLSDRYGDYSAQDVIIESDKTLKVLRHWGIPWEDFMNNDPPAKLAAGLAKHPLVVMCNKVNSAHGYYPNLKYYQMCGMRAEATGSTKGISFPAQLAAMISGQYGYGAESRAVIRARELLNLFMAFVTFDLKKAAQSGSMKDAAAIKPWLFGPEGNYKNLPVRLRVVGTKTVREDKLVYSYQAEAFGTETLNYFAITNPEDGYSAKRWSNHANTTYGDDPSRISGDLLAMDVNAIRELAFIRLLSAFSYLHMKASRIGDKLPAEVLTYRRLERSADGALVDNPVFGMYDPIAELNIKAGDKFKEFSIPVNPRIRRVRPSKKTIGVNVQAPLDAYTGVDSGVKNIKQMLDVTDGVHVPTWNSLSNEVWQRHEIQRAVKKRVLVLMQDARAKNTAIRLADTMQLDKTVIGSMMQMNRQARERLMTSGTLLREVTSYPTDCITNTATYKGKLVRGQVGVTPGGKALCCPSLTYSGNLAVCGKGKLACHADCITQSSYPASGTMMTWEDHQRNVLGTPEAKIALEKARAAAALAAAKKKSGAAAGDSTGAGGAGTISLIVGALVLSKLLK